MATAYQLVAIGVLLSFQQGLAKTTPAEDEVLRLEATAADLLKKVSDVRKGNALLEAKKEAFSVTADLVSGKRKNPPRSSIVEVERLRPVDGPLVIDNRLNSEDGVFKRWLNLKDGVSYRVRAKLAIREIRETDNFKFGCMIVRGAESSWPSANIGGSPFARREVSFDFALGKGESALLLMGFESGKGVAEIDEVRVCELREMVK